MMDRTSVINRFRPDLKPFEQVYRNIHQNPELSKQEVLTASLAATHLKALSGFVVHERIGGYGVVGVLENGVGPTVLLRADMDALPHLESTGLDYASTKVVTGNDGKQTPVMHACGHDMHVASLMATATLLHAAKSQWSGSLICLFQPAEETASGARAMVADGLYEKYNIPMPDIVLGEHVHALKTGIVAINAGPVLTAVDSFDVRIFGKSGHICRADLCVDPILIASQIVVRLQSIVTKEVRPEEFAVVACASIHGGSAANIVPDFVDMKISIRSYLPAVHERLITAVKRVVRAECQASGSEKEPEFKTIMHAPSTINDPQNTEILKTAFTEHFGDKATESDPFGASEDFSELAKACGAPYLFFMYGCVDEQKWDEAEKAGRLSEIPHNHSAFFAPVIQPTMKTAVDAFAVAALTFFDRSLSR